MNQMTHETCSELLRPYLEGELDETRREEVRAHLAGCAGCALELAALEALRPIEVTPMSELERAEMRRTVRSSVISPARVSWKERWGRRLAPALGAAALLIVIAIGVVSLGEGRDGGPAEVAGNADTSDEAREQDAAGQTVEDAETFEGGAGADSGRGGGDPQPKAESLEVAAPSEDSAKNDTDAIAGRIAASTVLTYSDGDFARARFRPRTLIPGDVRRDHTLLDSRLDELAASAPGERLRETIYSCARSTIGASSYPLVVTYAAYFAGDDVLLIGFLWIDNATGDMNYQLRGWRNHMCDRPSPIYRAGVISDA